MASASEHGQQVLSAILPKRRDLLDVALRRLTAKHFPEKTQANLFTMLERYAGVTGAVMPEKYLSDLLSKRDTGQAQLYVETYQTYSAIEVEDSEFHWSVQQLRELAAEQSTKEVITDALEVVVKGKELEGGEVLRGHLDARSYLLERFADIDRELTMQEAPEGDMREEESDILSDYAERKKARLDGTSTGIQFGIRDLDDKIGGMQRGELILAAGYSSDGKSTLCVQAAWSAAVEQGKNVLFLTTETLRPQIRRKILSRHSLLPQFNIPDGLNSRALKNGTLTPGEEQKFQDIVHDLAKNPNYGRVYIVQVPRSSTIGSLEQRMYRISREFDIDLVIMDYLALLVSDRRRQTTREELAAIMREAKQVATTFQDGRGVPLMSPWQVSREARTDAERLGQYTTRALSETAEATNSADIIISLLAPTDNTDRRAEVTMQVLKNRDGETANGLMVDVDYATSAFRSRSLGFHAATSVQQVGQSQDLLSFA